MNAQSKTSPRSRRKPALSGPILELLENRILASVSMIESIDGSGNNIKNPSLGSVNQDLLRQAPAAYADGISAPAGADRPSARLISDVIDAQSTDIENNRNLSDLVYVWGQFLDHDLSLTGSGSPADYFNIAVPTGDPEFDPNSTGTQIIPLARSIYDTKTGLSTSNPRQQINQITAFIDGSMVYGSDAARAAALRTFTGGKLKTSDGNLLPLNTDGFANANDAHIVADDQLFLAGDVRANENIELTAMQTLFVREHNQQADKIAAKNPTWTDEQIFQKARSIVIGEIQAITYNEFLPALLGQKAIKPYTGYKPNVNPNITNEFSTAGYRFGHSMLDDNIDFVDNNGNTTDTVGLAQAFFNPTLVEQNGIDGLLKGMSSGNAQEIDTKVVDSVRNFLFGQPGQGGFDLASLNIQRGRDNGLSDYNTTRAAYGLPKVTSFAQITSDTTVQAQLQQLYGDVNHIDLWVGALAEDHVKGASVGALTSRILVDQFTRLRDGDRFFYLNQFKGKELAMIQTTHLSDIIKRNSTITNLQPNVFYYNEYSQQNYNGQQPPPPPPPPASGGGQNNNGTQTQPPPPPKNTTPPAQPPANNTNQTPPPPPMNNGQQPPSGGGQNTQNSGSNSNNSNTTTVTPVNNTNNNQNPPPPPSTGSGPANRPAPGGSGTQQTPPAPKPAAKPMTVGNLTKPLSDVVTLRMV